MTTDAHPLDPSRTVRLRNKTCPYCGVHLDSVERDLEHVIGRKFVPTGTMNATWNLHVLSCRRCNGEKAELENDLSAITQLGWVWGAEAPVDEGLLHEAHRKAQGSTSARTGKPVIKSQESVTLRGNLGPAAASITMTGPPQLDLDRVNQLALFQLKAFFYWCTYDEETRLGHGWPGVMFPLNGAARQDFGNAVQTAFAKHVIGWEQRFVGTTAAGHYRVAIRKDPAKLVWSFGLEWNRNHRLVGFFGDEQACEAECDLMPRLKVDFFHQVGAELYTVRKERTIDAGDDILFAVTDG